MKTNHDDDHDLPTFVTDIAGISTTTYRRTDYAGDPYLFDFISTHCPSAATFYVTDVDLVLRTRDGKIMLVEVKRRGAKVKPAQAVTYRILDAALRTLNGRRITIMAGDGQNITLTVDYKGIHLLTFENTTFENGNAWFDGVLVTADQVARILSME